MYEVRVCAGGSSFGGLYLNPPKGCFLLLMLSAGPKFQDSGSRIFVRVPFEQPPVDTWIYNTRQYMHNYDVLTVEPLRGMFFPAWVAFEDGKPVLAIDHIGPFGYTDVGTDCNVFGLYQPAIYQDTVPEISVMTNGFIRIHAGHFDEMTPQRMIAIVRNTPGF